MLCSSSRTMFTCHTYLNLCATTIGAESSKEYLQRSITSKFTHNKRFIKLSYMYEYAVPFKHAKSSSSWFEVHETKITSIKDILKYTNINRAELSWSLAQSTHGCLDYGCSWCWNSRREVELTIWTPTQRMKVVCCHWHSSRSVLNCT